MHIGMGNPGVWGAGGKGDSAPEWLSSAFNGSKFDPIAEVMAAAPAKSPASDLQASAPVQSVTVAQDTKPESRNGILIQAYNKLTGSNFQVPEKILGADTDKLTKGFAGLGDFAKTLMDQDQAINKQIQANARSSGRSSKPVEMSFMTSGDPLRKRKKGGISGLGGYLI